MPEDRAAPDANKRCTLPTHRGECSMAHFRGVVQGGRGKATRNGHKTTGLTATAASWRGAIEVSLSHDTETGEDRFEVRQIPWQGAGISEVIAEGVIGEPSA